MAISLPLIGRRKKPGDKPRFTVRFKISFPKIRIGKKSGAGGGAKG